MLLAVIQDLEEEEEERFLEVYKAYKETSSYISNKDKP
jgi:hypothetical protein